VAQASATFALIVGQDSSPAAGVHAGPVRVLGRIQIPGSEMTSTENPVLLFADQAAWHYWLGANHASSTGAWLRLAKKGSPVRSVSYAEALETALCYGWIDAQKKPENEQFWRQRFAPRRAKSIWSKVNREKAAALIKAGRMQPAGMEQVAKARQDGRWDAAYDSPVAAAPPADLEAALQRNPPARAFFQTLDRANRYAILWRIQTAKKDETRARRIQKFIEMLEKHEKIHP